LHHEQNAAAQTYDYTAYPAPGGVAGFVAQDSPAAAQIAAAAATTTLSFSTGQNPHIPPAFPLETVVTHAPMTIPIPTPHPDDGKKRKRFTNEEKEAVKKGVEQYGPGDWKSIKQHYYGILHHRTPVQIKDCYRTMVKRGDLPETWGQEAKEARKAARKAGKLFGFYNPPSDPTAAASPTHGISAVANQSTTSPPSPSSQPKRRKFSKEEKKALMDGIEKLGVGNWKMIREEYADIFGDRTGQQLKDLYRTMVRLGQMPKVEESEESMMERKKRCAEVAREAKRRKKTMMEKHFSANARSAEAAAKTSLSLTYGQQQVQSVPQPDVIDPNAGQAYAQPLWMHPHQSTPVYPTGYIPQHQDYAYNSGYHNFDQGAHHATAYAGYQAQQPQQPSEQDVEASYYHWPNLWPKLIERGWTKLRANSQQRTALQVEYIFVLPGHDPRKGQHGTDYFASEDEVVEFIRFEHSKQRKQQEKKSDEFIDEANDGRVDNDVDGAEV